MTATDLEKILIEEIDEYLKSEGDMVGAFGAISSVKIVVEMSLVNRYLPSGKKVFNERKKK
jgi:hypothetical protein